jgi:hypothetical protein
MPQLRLVSWWLYLLPEFSFRLNAAGRIFTNPVVIPSLGIDGELEMGVNVSLGAFYVW